MSRSNGKKERYFERLSLAQRIQHMVLISSFTTLVITGLPVRYPDSKAAEIMIRSMGGMTARGVIHRVAAVMLVGLCLYHLFFVLFSKRGHDDFVALMPKKRDLTDLIKQMKFYFGLSRTGPRYDRFNWIEKFEYLAMGWGSVVMITTGFLLWFESQAMLVLPKWMLDIALVVHSYEALLAFLAIIIWHCYHVHLNPESFPMNKVWLTGLIAEEELRKHHPEEYDRILRDEIPPVEVPSEKKRVKVGPVDKRE